MPGTCESGGELCQRGVVVQVFERGLEHRGPGSFHLRNPERSARRRIKKITFEIKINKKLKKIKRKEIKKINNK